MGLKEYRHKIKQQRIRRLLHKLGVDIKKLDPEITDRLTLLEETTPTIKDEKRALKYARKIFRHYKKEHPDRAFSEQEKTTVEVGTMLTDIGKSGPAKATEEQEKLIARMFAVESVENPKMSVEQFLKKHFGEAANDYAKILQSMGIDPKITMRRFWNKHSEWTYAILKDKGVPQEAIPAASTHHRLEGVNPENIVGEKDKYTKPFGKNKAFNRAEKLIILLDKYDAYRRRGGKSHKEAVTALNKQIKNTRYKNDKEFKRLLGDIENTLS